MKAFYYKFSKRFTELECEELKNYALAQGLQTSKISSGICEEIRKSKQVWLKPDHIKPYRDRLTLAVLEANVHCFDLELSNSPNLSYESFQFTEYSATVDAKYHWHEDCDPLWDKPIDRKLSVVVQLTNPTEYEGGCLEFERFNLGKSEFVEMGDVIVFPSFLRHRVTTVTKGVRHSLVNWYLGPKFA